MAPTGLLRRGLVTVIAAVGLAALGVPAALGEDEGQAGTGAVEYVNMGDSYSAASGVLPPVGRSCNRRAAVSIEDVGGSASVASAPRNVIKPTLSLRWYASSRRESTAALTAPIRRLAAIDPDASTTSSTRLDSRPSVTASRRSGPASRSGSSWRRARSACRGAAARMVAVRCSRPLLR